MFGNLLLSLVYICMAEKFYHHWNHFFEKHLQFLKFRANFAAQSSGHDSKKEI